jgi:hypothetical protein
VEWARAVGGEKWEFGQTGDASLRLLPYPIEMVDSDEASVA